MNPTAAISAWVDDHVDQLQLCLVSTLIGASAWAIEQRWPGSALVVTGAGLLCAMKSQLQHGEGFPCILQRLLGINGEPDAIQPCESSTSIQEESKEEINPELDDFQVWPQTRESGNFSGEAVDIEALAWPDAGLLTGPTSLLQSITGDMTNGMNVSDDGSSGNCDRMTKSQLDLLFRYMASVEGRHHEQGSTPQRQKLQRKLLLRGATTRRCKAPQDDGSKVAACNGVNLVSAPGSEGEAQEDKGAIEQLLRELGEAATPTKAGGVSNKKARRKGVGPGRAVLTTTLKSRQRSPGTPGTSDAEPNKSRELNGTAIHQEGETQAVAERREAKTEGQASAEPDCQEAALQSASAGTAVESSGDSLDEASPIAIATEGSLAEGGLPQAVSAEASVENPAPADTTSAEVGSSETPFAEAAAENNDLVVEPVTEGFQVVANRKARRKGRKSDGDCNTSTTCTDKADTEESNVPHEVPEAPALMQPGEIRDDAAEKDCSSSASAAGKLNGVEVTLAHQASPTETVQPEPHTEEVKEGEALDAEEEEEEEEEEDWEWQCPAGYRLEPYLCQGPVRCSSCGQQQPAGSPVLWSSESGWIACQECIRIAWEQPVELLPQEDEMAQTDAANTNPAGDAVEASLPDPTRMTAVEIAQWFKQYGAEDALRHCMQEVAARSLKQR